jgi:periplasmic copper chaperone A
MRRLRTILHFNAISARQAPVPEWSRSMKHKTRNHKTWNHKIWLLAVLLSLSGGAAAAETYTVGSIEIANPWARATPKGAAVGGAYMTITNKGPEADRLIGISSPIANQLAVHQMVMDKGVMSMRPVQGGLEIKPGQTVELKPQSFHLMLMGLKRPLAQGERVKATLEFAKAGTLDLEYVVESMGAQGPSGAAPAGMDHGAMEHPH